MSRKKKKMNFKKNKKLFLTILPKKKEDSDLNQKMLEKINPDKLDEPDQADTSKAHQPYEL
jgi:hypothetical protein